jgi:hypothetical protein
LVFVTYYWDINGMAGNDLAKVLEAVIGNNTWDKYLGAEFLPA